MVLINHLLELMVMFLLALVCELIRSTCTYTNFNPDAIYNLQCFVGLMFDSVCAFCHWTVWNNFFMFHALEYTFVLKVEIICAYIACIVINIPSTTEQNEVHIMFFSIYNLDMTLIIIWIEDTKIFVFLAGIEKWLV